MSASVSTGLSVKLITQTHIWFLISLAVYQPPPLTTTQVYIHLYNITTSFLHCFACHFYIIKAVQCPVTLLARTWLLCNSSYTGNACHPSGPAVFSQLLIWQCSSKWLLWEVVLSNQGFPLLDIVCEQQPVPANYWFKGSRLALRSHGNLTFYAILAVHGLPCLVTVSPSLCQCLSDLNLHGHSLGTPVFLALERWPVTSLLSRLMI